MELDLLSLKRALVLCAAIAGAACAGGGAAVATGPTATPSAAPPSAATPSAVPSVMPVATAPTEVDAGAELTKDAAPPETPPTPSPLPEPPPLPEGTVVLHIGDSMAGALGVALNAELKQHNVRGMLRFKVASYIPGWAGGLELPLHLSQLKPDLVLITLGTNEVKMPDPTQRAPLVRKIVKMIGDRPCVWIAPPVWTVEKGLYQVIRDNLAPCRYMDTELVYPEMPRLNDKIHPTIGARKEWAKRVVAWLLQERRPTEGKPWALAPE